ncbi:hypothetical protein [Edaphocola aurantiacus]|uniref:hypothetical protein n=1 Tax=Edaphocola aurantiacus TaxID=2601682 RepID=UPI001C94D93A|nr:hypothetical protein [Edaphocola aurantiacus]
MKKVTLFFIAISLSFATFAQLQLKTAIVNVQLQDSIINYLKNNKEYFAKFHVLYPKIFEQDIKLQIINLNYVEISNEKKFGLKNRVFLENLDAAIVGPYAMQISSLADNKLLLCNVQMSNTDSFEVSVDNRCQIEQEYNDKIAIFSKFYDLSKTKIVIIQMAIYDLFFLYDDKIYAIKDNTVIDGMLYLRKKYRNKKGFLKQFNAKMY